jgi:DNA-binding NtrC family response regulator
MSEELRSRAVVPAAAGRARTWVRDYERGRYTEVVRDWLAACESGSAGTWADAGDVVEAVGWSLALTKAWPAYERFRSEILARNGHGGGGAAAEWLLVLDAWRAVHDARYDSAAHAVRARRPELLASGSAARTLAHGLKVEGVALMRMGRYDEADAATRRALDLFADAGDRLQVAHCATNLGLILNARGELAAARDALGRAVDELAAAGAAEERLALARVNLAVVELHAGRVDAARALYEQSLRTFEELGLTSERITALNGLGHCARALGRFDAALGHHRAALALGTPQLARQVGLSHEFIGRVLFERGERPSASTHYGRAFEIAANIAPEGDLMLEICWHLAELQVAAGRLDAAADLLVRAEDLCTRSGERRELGCVQRARAGWLAARGEHAAAAALFDVACETLRGGGRILESLLTRFAAGEAAITAGDRARGIAALLAARDGLMTHFAGSGWIDRVESALERHAGGAAVVSSDAEPRHGFCTRDPELLALLEDLPLIARTAHPVLIQGESGTGKELLARAVHALSARNGACIAINCAAIPRDLFESELFGHVRGSFSGAQSDKPGLLEQADGGTLILDEVGEMPLEMQAKLLRVLDDGVVRRVGDVRQVRVDVKVVAATNRALEAAVATGTFRADLYHRLAVHPIDIKPLRERPGDIELLARYLLRREGLETRFELDADTIAELVALPWTGNARELRNHLVRAATQRRPQPAVATTGSKALRVTRSSHERRAIETALAATGGNVVEAARTLRLHTTTLRRKMRALGVERRA